MGESVFNEDEIRTAESFGQDCRGNICGAYYVLLLNSFNVSLILLLLILLIRPIILLKSMPAKALLTQKRESSWNWMSLFLH